MKRLWRLIGIFLIAAMTAGCGKSVEQQIAEQMELGRKYLAEASYEEAIIAFNQAIELEPKMFEAYIGIAQSYEGLNEYGEISRILDQGIQNIGLEALSEENIEQLTDTYNRLADYFSQQGNIEAELSCYKKILLLQPDNQKVLKKEEELQTIGENKVRLEDMARSIVEEDSYDFQDMEILSDEFQMLIAELEEPVIFPAEEGMYLGIYPGGYIYYGEMKEGRRNGSGYWYYGDIERMNIVFGVWEEDVPNGEFVVEGFTNPDTIEREEGHTYGVYSRYSGRVEAGIYEEEWNIFWDMENNGCDHEWDVFYVNGIQQAVSTKSDGRGVAAYCEKCGANLLCEDKISRIVGDY